MKSIFCQILILVIAFPTVGIADSVTDSLKKIRGVLEDPVTGLKATNQRVHRDHAGFYINMITQDLAYLAFVLNSFQNALHESQQRLTIASQQLRTALEEVKADTSITPQNKFQQFLALASAADRAESDATKLANWEARLIRDRQALIATFQNQCSGERLQLMKASFSGGYLQRQSISVDHFSDQVNEMFTEIQGSNQAAEANLSLLSDLEEAARRGPQKPNFYVSMGYSTKDGMSGDFQDGQNVTYIASTVASAAFASAAVATTAAMYTAMMATGYGAVAVVAVMAFKALASCIGASMERAEQIRVSEEINSIIRAALPTPEEASQMIDDVCKSIPKNTLLENQYAELMKAQVLASVADLKMTGFAAEFWKAFEENRKAITPPQAAEIRTQIQSALTSSRVEVGHQNLALRRISEEVKNQKLPSTYQANPLAELEERSQRRALFLQVNGLSTKSPVKAALEEVLR